MCTTLYRNLIQASNFSGTLILTNFSFGFFYEIFTEDASLLVLYHDAKKSKMTKNSNQGGGGGSCLKKQTIWTHALVAKNGAIASTNADDRRVS